MDDCVFCKIVKGELPSSKVYEDEKTLVFKNIEPKAETHLLVVPKKHIQTFMDLGDEINDLLIAAQKVVKKGGILDGYKLVINGGKYQFVPHFHLHLLAGELEEI